MSNILSINFNKSIHDTFNGEFFNQGSLYYAPYQRELCELEPLETLSEVYSVINNTRNKYELPIEFKNFIEHKASESIVGEIQVNFLKDQNDFSYKTYNGKYVFFIILLYKFSVLYFQKPDKRIRRIIDLIKKENDSLKYNPFSHILLKEFHAEFNKYSSNNDIRDYIIQTMNLLYGKKELRFYSEIFVTQEKQDFFVSCMIRLNAIDEISKKAKKGVCARANAIFSNKNAKETIFLYKLLLKDYILFLQDAFVAPCKDLTHLSLFDETDEKMVSDFFKNID